MTEVIKEESLSSSLHHEVNPAELAAQIDASLKALLVLIGQSMQAKRRLAATLRMLREKEATSGLDTKDEMIFMQQYNNGSRNKIPGLKALEGECLRYDSLVKEFSRWIGTAKDVLMQELEKTRAREEVERIERERKEHEAEVERLKEEEKKKAADEVQRKAAEGEKKKSNAIVVDDDDEDDVPLASRDGTKEASKSTDSKVESIDLTDSPRMEARKTAIDNTEASNAAMTDPAAFLAALTSTSTSNGLMNEAASAMALDNFDFSQLGLQNMNTSGGGFGGLDQGSNFNNDPLDFSMDFLDYNSMENNDAMQAAGGMVDTSALFSNIDFGALLGNSNINNEGKDNQ